MSDNNSEKKVKWKTTDDSNWLYYSNKKEFGYIPKQVREEKEKKRKLPLNEYFKTTRKPSPVCLSLSSEAVPCHKSFSEIAASAGVVDSKSSQFRDTKAFKKFRDSEDSIASKAFTKVIFFVINEIWFI